MSTKQEGYLLKVCSCPTGPYLGARRAGTPCCCESCGFITRDQLDALFQIDTNDDNFLTLVVERLHQPRHDDDRGWLQLRADTRDVLQALVAILEEEATV
jgi:hypothetical protein